MDSNELFETLKNVARSMGVVDISVSPVERWFSNPLVSSRIGEGHRPTDIMPDAKSVIVLGIPIQKTILDTAPSIYYNHLYSVVNNLLDQVSERLALELIALGHNAVYVPRDGYQGVSGLKDKTEAFFSHRHAAYLAGMGTFGWNNMLLTKKYGPRVRLVSVITTAELPYGDVLTEDLCIHCKKCTKECPVLAVASEDYPKGITNKLLCLDNSAELAHVGKSPCGRCIAVCPVGLDKNISPSENAIQTIRSYHKVSKTEYK